MRGILVGPESIGVAQAGFFVSAASYRWRRIVCAAVLLWSCSSSHAGVESASSVMKAGEFQPPLTIDLAAQNSFAAAMARVVQSRIIYVGETHDRFEHHVNQLEVIKRLREAGGKIAIGVEFFQQPYQSHLDDYINGKIDETEMLRRTDYFDRWGFDYRFYRPIMQYARLHGIPVIALDVAQDVSRKVGREGLKSLTEQERGQIPVEIDMTDEGYRERLRESFAAHDTQRDFDNFMTAQLVRDETMAENTAAYLKNHADARMVILAGTGHIAYRSGIPARVARRTAVPATTIVQTPIEEMTSQVADYLLASARIELPETGKLGVFLKPLDKSQRGVGIVKFADGSPAQKAGVLVDDSIVAVNDQATDDVPALKALMMDKKPGETVTLMVRRGEENKTFQFSLQ